MNQTFEEYLQSNNVDEDSLLVAMHTYLSEQTDYLPEASMRAEMTGKAADATQMEQLLQDLEGDKASLVGVAHIVLGSVWHDPEQQELVKDAIDSAKQKLPVIEVGIIAIVAMYGMYLIATGGVGEHTKTTIGADGSITTETTKYEPPTSPLKMIVNLFHP